MDTPIQTSFIPKQSLAGDRPRRDPGNLLFTISMVILVLSILGLALSIGVRYFLFDNIYRDCDSGSAGKCGLKKTLALNRESLDPNSLQQIKNLDLKIRNGQTLLNNHTSVRPLFDLLSKLTVQSIQYRKFEFGPEGVKIEGIARGYEDVAVQSRIFASEENKEKIRNFIFSDLDLDQKGNVVFKLALTVDPTILKFKEQSGF